MNFSDFFYSYMVSPKVFAAREVLKTKEVDMKKVVLKKIAHVLIVNRKDTFQEETLRIIFD